MKACPECRSRYDSDTSFCPADGTQLVDISHVAENWSGRELTPTIHLDDLWESTPAGDRYTARDNSFSDDLDLLTTLLNRRGRPESTLPDDLVNLLSETPPTSILAVRGFDLSPDGMPPWIAEEHPGVASSLRHRIDSDDDPLDWEVGVRTTIFAARTLHWMANQGHLHPMWHPGALYMDASGDTIRIGDWLQGHALADEQASDLPEHAESPWRGFQQYIAPECIDGAEPTPRSLVYALGVTLFESITGELPFENATATADASERGTPPNIADHLAGAHPELSDILEVMLAPAPADRFDHPDAAAAALASLLSASLKTVAPDLEPRESAPFAHNETLLDLGQVAEQTDTDSATEGETLMGIPAADTSTAEAPEPATDESDDTVEPDSVVSGESESSGTSDLETAPPSEDVPTIIIDDDDRPDSDADDQPAEQSSGLSRIRMQTLKAWQRGTLKSDAAETLENPDLPVSVIGFVDISESNHRPSIRQVGVSFTRPDDSPPDLPPTIPDDDLPPDEDTDSDDPAPGADSKTDSMFPDEGDTSAERPAAGDSTPDVELRESDVSDVESSPQQTETGGVSDTDESTDSQPDDPSDVTEPDAQNDSRQQSDDFDAVVGDFDKGSPEIDDPDDFDNEWFSKSSEDAWMEQDIREGRDQAEQTRRYVLWIGLGLLVSLALSVVVYAEFGPSEASGPDGQNPEQATSAEQNPAD